MVRLTYKLTITALVCIFVAIITNYFIGGGYWVHLRISLAFGFPITILANIKYFKTSLLPQWVSNTIALLGGFSIGMLHLLSVMFDDPLRQSIAEDHWELIAVYATVSFAICAGVFYIFTSTMRLHSLRREIAEHAAIRAQKEHLLTLSELKVLQSQMEPHFLFNTLATIQGLIDNEPNQAKQMINALASMLRTNLQRTRSDQGTLAQELNLVNDYLAIQKIRLGERFTYTIQISDDLMECHCPPLLLQPLVENALVHSIEQNQNGGTLTISGYQESDLIRLNIENTGLAFGESKHEGNGMSIQNIRERLSSLYPEHSFLRIKQLKDNQSAGTCVQVCFPKGSTP